MENIYTEIKDKDKNNEEYCIVVEKAQSLLMEALSTLFFNKTYDSFLLLVERANHVVIDELANITSNRKDDWENLREFLHELEGGGSEGNHIEIKKPKEIKLFIYDYIIIPIVSLYKSEKYKIGADDINYIISTLSERIVDNAYSKRSERFYKNVFIMRNQCEKEITEEK